MQRSGLLSTLLLCAALLLTGMPWPGNNQPLVQAQPQTLQRPDGYALDFDGVNDFVRLENPAQLNFTGQITLESWIKPRDTATLQNIVAHGFSSSSPVREVFLRLRDGKYQVGSFSDPTTFMAEAPIPNGDVGSWVHLAGVYDGTRWILYRNGVEVDRSVAAQGSIAVSSAWAIGARGENNDSRFFNGVIDEVRIWNSALSPAQLGAALPAPPPANLVGAWAFEEGLGASAYDATGFRATGHLGAGAADAAPRWILERAAVQIDLNCTAPPYGTAMALSNEAEAIIGSHDVDGNLRYRQFDLLNNSLVEQDLAIGAPGNRAATTAADLSGDGRQAYVQASRSATGQLQLAIHRQGIAPVEHLESSVIGQNIETVGVTGLALDPATTDEALAVAFAPASGGLYVMLKDMNESGQLIHSYAGNNVTWYDSGYAADLVGDRSLQVLGADINGDGIEELLLGAFDGRSFQLLVLAYDPNRYVTATWGHEIRLRQIASYEFALPNDYRSARLHAGDIDGDFRAEPVVGWIAKDNNGPDIVTVHMLDQDRNGQFVLVDWQTQTSSNTLALAVGNTNLDPTVVASGDPNALPDFAAEIVVAYDDLQSNGWRLQTLSYNNGALSPHNSLFQSGNGVQELDLAVADMDGDSVADIALASRWDPWRIALTQLVDRPEANTSLRLESTWQVATEDSRDQSLTLQLLDWDNNAVRAIYNASELDLACRQINEREIEAVVHHPPWWRELQADANRYATFGREASGATDQSTSVSNEKSTSVSGYLGRNAGASLFDIISFEHDARVTAGYESSSSEVRGTGRISTTTVFEGHADYSGNFVAFNNTVLNCYSYRLSQADRVSDSTLRYCQTDSDRSTRETALTDAWHIQGGNQPMIVDPNAPQNATWAPVTRDWSSLSLFKPVQASAGCSANWAEGAVNLNTSDIATCDQSGAWWQVDLGAIRDITHIRVWGGEHYQVFIAPVDPTRLPGHEDPAQLKAVNGISSFARGAQSSPVSTFVTLQPDGRPLRGRYIRIQSDGHPALSLAEVQVFDSRHVEPERYPFDVSDPTPDDGKHRVSLVVDGVLRRNLETRGNLIGAVEATGTVRTGSANYDWSLSQESVRYFSNETSYSWTSRHGVEMDVVLANIAFGGGVEWSSGTTRSSSRTTSWGSGLILGGGIAGLPSTNGNGEPIAWPGSCDYSFQPYYYEIEDYSNYGFTQRYMVLDYAVPSLDQNAQTDRTACRYGIADRVGIDDAPTAIDDYFATTAGSDSISLNILANDRDPEGATLTITGVDNAAQGQVVIDAGQLRYQPAPGFVGEDRFSYTVSDGGQTASASVSVTVIGTGSTGSTRIYMPLVLR